MMVTSKLKLPAALLGWLALALLTACSGAPASGPESLEDVARRYMARDDVPGLALIVLEDGEVTRRAGLGVADEASQRPVTPSTLFRVESLSKPVAAWGAMQLVEAGTLELDAPVSDCLGDWAARQGVSQLTARQLLSHSAGLGLGDYAARYRPGSEVPSLETFLSGDIAFTGAPGAAFSYSDTGYLLLQLVMEACSSVPFGTLIMEQVAGPLGMSGASFDGAAEGLATGHDLRGRPVAPYVYPGLASGGLIANADAMAAFVQAGAFEASQPVLSADARARLYEPVVPVEGLYGFTADSYGLGYFIETLPDGRKAVWHGGQGYGWMSHIHLIPETGDGIIMLSNSQRAWPLFAAVLEHWSGQVGAAPVGMSRILAAGRWARIVTGALGLLAAAGFVLAWQRRRLPVSLRIICGAAGGVMIGVPVWMAAQDYLFIFSILPALWPWLALSMAVFGLSLLVLSLFSKSTG